MTGILHRPIMHNPHITGVWMTGNGYIRLRLTQAGRFSESWGGTERAYEGCYTTAGATVVFIDDSGLVTLGEWTPATLYLRGEKFVRVH